MTYIIETFGCKVNQCQSAAAGQRLRLNGFTPCGEREAPDVVIINSCTVTGNSDKKVIREISRMKKRFPEAKIVLTGCFPAAFPDKARETEADFIAFSNNLDELYSLLSLSDSSDVPGIDSIMLGKVPDIDSIKKRTRAFIDIQNGCDNFCTYCIIPKARGSELRSRPVREIADMAEKAARFHKEIVLTGINLVKYNSEYNGKQYNLADIVQMITRIPGVARVRLSSVEPENFLPEMFAPLSNNSAFCAHFHMSLQSGSNGVLSRMGRRYTREDYRRIMLRLAEMFPGAAFTTDVIAGFPGESDGEFRETEEFLRECSFARLHIFTYSRREGTAAAEMPGQIPEHVKRDRYLKLKEAGNELQRNFLLPHVGKSLEILTEKPHVCDKQDNAAYSVGRAKDYTKVVLYDEEIEKGKLLTVKIISAENDRLVGEVV
ncbi:tRNA (N(6)-L-threonylcarbamoyladenosine(37)-C(2))-methylthiotransferase MtaB [Clostridia bacterium]|nr:tRNA (N(6)-L-threonylcarbamoyladenosine(37)-C(2))-methylthiotransferase MtaB [Clostridia bacterium]